MFFCSIWSELGISGGTAVVILLALYFVVKWAVKNGVKEAFEEMRAEQPAPPDSWNMP